MTGENRSNRSRRRDRRETEQVDLVAATMERLGWLAPTTEQQVQLAEEVIANDVAALPEALADSGRVFDGGGRDRRTVEFPVDPEVASTLARAAREGGRISPEVEEAMRRDRAAAEAEQDDATKGETDIS